MSQSQLGALIWESPSQRPAPKILSLVIAIAFFIVGGIVVCAIYPELQNGTVDGKTLGALGVILLMMFGGGAAIVYGAFFGRPPRGIEFHERGLVYGPPGLRQAVEYASLKSIEFERIDDATHQRDRAIATAGLVISMIAANPSGIGYRLSQLNAEKTESIAVITPRGEKEFRVAVFEGKTDPIQLAAKRARGQMS